MGKEHNVILSLVNNTGSDLKYVREWFDSGRVADSYLFPTLIKDKESVKVMCYEKDWSTVGCSGYVTYSLDGYPITIGFSNPSMGSNKLGGGLTGKDVWENMTNNDYDCFSQQMKLPNGVIVNATGQCTGGRTNEATMTLARG